MKIGIMGGTFDPIHNGHLMLGRLAYEQFHLDEVWFMPNGNPPHKEQTSIKLDARTRAEMVQIAIAGETGFKLEEYEVNRSGISYSYETIEHFHTCFPDDSFYFIIGADSLFAIETWKHPERLLSSCTILAACRDHIDTREEMNKQIRYLEEKYHAKIELLNSPLFHVSSHELRTMIYEGKNIEGLVPENIREHIVKERLYES